MLSFSPAALRVALNARVPPTARGAFCVAFSGGVDSTVLLTALAREVAVGAPWRLRAVHVDHQLHSDSPRWADHCQNTAEMLGVPCAIRRVNVSTNDPYGPEAAARTARYDALRQVIEADEVLLTAHHGDDQLETMLLALMRGAGVRGLAGMSVCQRFAAGWLVRPLLDFRRAALEQWARSENLPFIVDPTNAATRFDRNYLRHEILPLLERRWPAATRNAVRSSGHLREAEEMLDALAATDHAAASVGPCLRLASLEALDAMRCRNLLRHWVRRHGAPAPSTRKLAALQHDMWAAGADRTPCVTWDRFEVRRHRGLLYCLRSQSPLEAQGIDWDGERPLTLPAGLGRLRAEQVIGAGIAGECLQHGLHVAFRAGRELIRPAGDAHHRTLKKLLQSSAILPWWRNRVPLIRIGRKLAAVGDLWVAEEFAAARDKSGMRIVWDERPPIEAQKE